MIHKKGRNKHKQFASPSCKFRNFNIFKEAIRILVHIQTNKDTAFLPFLKLGVDEGRGGVGGG